jgi:hypothetical protein
MGCSGAIMVLCSLLFYHKWSSDISNISYITLIVVYCYYLVF